MKSFLVFVFIAAFSILEVTNAMPQTPITGLDQNKGLDQQFDCDPRAGCVSPNPVPITGDNPDDEGPSIPWPWFKR